MCKLHFEHTPNFMRKRLLLLGYLALFWLFFTITIRALFLAYNHDLTGELNTSDIFKIFLHGLKMDISLTGYFLMAAGLILSISLLLKNRWPYFALNALNIFLIIACGVLASVDLELYRHWGFRLNTAPLFYMQGGWTSAPPSCRRGSDG